MSIIARYLLREFLLSTGSVLVTLLVTWVSADTLLHLDDLTGKPGGAVGEILYRSLEILPIGVPISCLTGIVWSLTHAVRYREVTAIRSGGIPLQTVLLPILMVCLAIGAALAVFEDRIIIPTRRALHEAAQKNFEPEHVPIRLNNRWWYASGASLFSAGQYASEQKTLRDVTVFQLDAQHRIAKRIDSAEAVNLGQHTWELHDNRVYVFQKARVETIRQEPSLRLDLGLSGQDLSRAAPRLEFTTLHRLLARIRSHRGSDSMQRNLQTTLHKRFAQPLSVLILVLLSLPFALGNVEQHDSLPRALVQSVSVGAVFWTVWALGLLTAHNEMIPAPFPIWTVPVLFLGWGLWRFRRIKE